MNLFYKLGRKINKRRKRNIVTRKVELCDEQARMQGSAIDASTRKKSNLRKIEKKEGEKLTKSRKLTKITIMPFTNGSKVMSFRGGNPVIVTHPQFFRSPRLPKINPAYALGDE